MTDAKKKQKILDKLGGGISIQIYQKYTSDKTASA